MLNKIVKWYRGEHYGLHHCGFDFMSNKVSTCVCGRSFFEAVALPPRTIEEIRWS